MKLFSFGGANFDNVIKADSYKITPNARQDLDSYRDADGVLQRNALSHTATIVEFDTKVMHEPEMQALMSSIRGSYINYAERDANCNYYDPESGSTKSGHFYIDSNLSFSIKQVWDGVIFYDETHFKFVEY